MNEPIRLEETAADVMVNVPTRTPTLDDCTAVGATVFIDAAELARLRRNSARWEELERTAKQRRIEPLIVGSFWAWTWFSDRAETLASAMDAAIAARAAADAEKVTTL